MEEEEEESGKEEELEGQFGSVQVKCECGEVV